MLPRNVVATEPIYNLHFHKTLVFPVVFCSQNVAPADFAYFVRNSEAIE